MFKIPEKIKIGVTDYQVVVYNRMHDEQPFGLVDFRDSTIRLNAGVCEQGMASSFIHEILHAVVWSTAVNLDIKILSAVDNIEEYICKQLETGLAQVIDQIVEFNQDEKEPNYGRLLIRQICEVDRILTPLLDNNSKSKIMDTELGEPVITKEEDPHGFCHMVKHTERIAELLRLQLEHDKKATIDNKRVGELANRIAEYYKKEGNGCGGNCHLVLDDGNLEDSDIQFCKGYCAKADDTDGLYIMREMLSMNPEERQKVYDMASVLTNPRYIRQDDLDNSKEKS